MEPQSIGASDDGDGFEDGHFENLVVASESRNEFEDEQLESPASEQRQLESLVATRIAEMQILDPEVLRVTPAHKAFQNFAHALRPAGKGDFHRKSFVREEISSFWSHSWHGDPSKKILTLLMFYNGAASILIGTLVAFLMMILFSLGCLPGFSRGRHPNVVNVIWSTWALLSGFITSLLIFIFWRSQHLIFLDRICINQNDAKLKAASIFSLAGLLKRSQEMLLLWDSTWSDRLWCQFEMSAFLKSKEAPCRELLIRPTFLGPCTCTIFICAFLINISVTTVPLDGSGPLLPMLATLIFAHIVGYFMVLAFRNYFRGIQVLKEKMRSFSFDDSRCHCCDVDHQRSDGNTLICDKQIIKKCVSIWFGCQDAFEDFVQTNVTEKLSARLEIGVFTCLY